MNWIEMASPLVMRRAGLALTLAWAGWWVFFATGDAMVSHRFVGGVIFAALVIGIVVAAWKWAAAGGVLLVLASVASIGIWAPMWIRRFDFRQIVLMFAIMPLPPLVAGVLLFLSRRAGGFRDLSRIRKVLGATGKWLGRSTALLLLLFWGMFFVEHLSEWFLRADGRYPPAWVWVQQGFHFVMLAGLAMMLKWEKSGALVMAVGTTAFFGGIGFRGFPWMALINLVPIGCFSIYWLAESSVRLVGADAQGFRRAEKVVLATLGTGLTAFVLLCANEMLGNPPLLTPALPPSSALVGTWQATAQAWPGPSEIEVLLTVHADGTVSGEVGGAALAGARISGNRTWLGRLLKWRTDYLIRGELRGALGGAPLRNGDRFAVPLNLDGPELVGSIFTSGRDAGGGHMSSAPLVSRIRLKKM
jgi:hypothetical protein